MAKALSRIYPTFSALYAAELKRQNDLLDNLKKLDPHYTALRNFILSETPPHHDRITSITCSSFTLTLKAEFLPNDTFADILALADPLIAFFKAGEPHDPAASLLTFSGYNTTYSTWLYNSSNDIYLDLSFSIPPLGLRDIRIIETPIATTTTRREAVQLDLPRPFDWYKKPEQATTL